MKALGTWLVVLAVIGLGTPGWGYDAKGKRDPFVALVTPDGSIIEPRAPTGQRPGKTQPGALNLEGIVYGPSGGSVAVINGEIFEEGDVREGIEVVKIEPSRVIVIRDGLEQELRLPVPVGEEGGS